MTIIMATNFYREKFYIINIIIWINPKVNQEGLYYNVGSYLRKQRLEVKLLKVIETPRVGT